MPITYRFREEADPYQLRLTAASIVKQEEEEVLSMILYSFAVILITSWPQGARSS